MNVPNDTLVISKRKKKGGSTITGYKKTEIKKQFQKCLTNKNIELAIRWGIELHCSGNINDIFNSINLLILDFVLMVLCLDHLTKCRLIFDPHLKIEFQPLLS